jgi:hypothetical protein
MAYAGSLKKTKRGFEHQLCTKRKSNRKKSDPFRNRKILASRVIKNQLIETRSESSEGSTPNASDCIKKASGNRGWQKEKLTNGDIAANGGWEHVPTDVGLGHMHDAAVLDVGHGANLDAIHVS